MISEPSQNDENWARDGRDSKKYVLWEMVSTGTDPSYRFFVSLILSDQVDEGNSNDEDY